MTLPAAIWPYMMAMAASVAILSAIAGDGVRAALAVFGAYVAARLISAGLPFPWDLVAFAALWVAVGRYAVSQGHPISGGLFVACGLCYLWARLTGAPREVGSLPFVVSDVLAGVAMLLMGGRAVGALVGSGVLGGGRV
jgi:hypothetical protein